MEWEDASREAPRSAEVLKKDWESYPSWTFHRPQNAPIVIALYDDSERNIQPCLQLQQDQLDPNADQHGIAVALKEAKQANFYPFLMNCVQGEQCPHLFKSVECSQAAMQEIDAEHLKEDQVRLIAHAFVYLRKTQSEEIKDELDKRRLDPTGEVFDGYVQPPRIDPGANCWVFDFDLTLSRLPNFGPFGKGEDTMITTEDAAFDAFSQWRDRCIRQLVRHWFAGGELFSDFLKERFKALDPMWDNATCRPRASDDKDSVTQCAWSYFASVFTPENVMTTLIGGRKHMLAFRASMMEAVTKHNFGSKGPWIYILTDNGNYEVIDAFYNALFGDVVAAIHEKNGTTSLPSAQNSMRTFSKHMVSNIPPLYNSSKVDFIQNVISFVMAATMVDENGPVSARTAWFDSKTNTITPALHLPFRM